MTKKNTKAGAATYAVGRGKPPEQTRFKPGQSGNPGGRRKGSRNIKTLFEEIASTEMTLVENGKRRIVELREAVVMSLAKGAVSGDIRAIKDFLDRCERYDSSAAERVIETAEEDKIILQRALKLRDAATRVRPPSSSLAEEEMEAEEAGENGEEDSDE